MKDGFIKVSAATPEIRVADVEFNKEAVLKVLKEEYNKHTKIVVFPELTLTGYTCGDLFLQDTLIEAARNALRELVDASKKHDTLTFVGLPWEHESKLYDVLAVYQNGELLAVVPKTVFSDHSGNYESRYFCPGFDEPVWTEFFDTSVPFGTNILFKCPQVRGLSVAAVIGEDFLSPLSITADHAYAGATVIAYADAMPISTGAQDNKDLLICADSLKLKSAIIHANAGEGESTTDMVFAGHNFIAECGEFLCDTESFSFDTATTDIDVKLIANLRKRTTSFDAPCDDEYELIDFNLKEETTKLDRDIDSMPFIPVEEDYTAFDEIIKIQTAGLVKRLKHIGWKKVVIGISGGLDSTMALLVCAEAMDKMGLPRKNIHAVTMPCFGTTDRTYANACELIKRVGATFTEINIGDAVLVHLDDIGHDIKIHNSAYENAQARERTQVLMDISNDENSLVVGTGDLSELALGWATYNGDHMSMYGVNASVPKTLMRYLVSYYASTCKDRKLAEILEDIVDTPISPELLPAESGKISQKTEDIIGPYELHDFFIYYLTRFGFSPSKVYRMASHAFEGQYDRETILKWMKLFYKRFFNAQFKRSALPDGVDATGISLSPRGAFRMPSDAVSKLWLEEINSLEK